jgi:RNA polymerase sigma-70 factor (ECF subfamily)
LYWHKLYNVAFYYLREERDAEDVVQDVFISLWSRRTHLEIRTRLENYLVRSVKYTAFFYLKIKSRKKTFMKNLTVTEAVNDPQEYIDYKSVLDQLHLIFETVSKKTREIFYLSRFDGLTYAEIAQQLHISVKTVEYHISLALKRISVEEW